MQSGKWANMVTSWVSDDGKQWPGWLRRCCRDDLDMFEKGWCETAKDMEQWRVIKKVTKKKYIFSEKRGLNRR